MIDYVDQTTDYKREFELLAGVDTEYAELNEGRFFRTDRDARDYVKARDESAR
jgi:hypothetical protein